MRFRKRRVHLYCWHCQKIIRFAIFVTNDEDGYLYHKRCFRKHILQKGEKVN